jgi:hypothetical protein
MHVENRSDPATATVPTPVGKIHWWETPLPPSILASLLLLGVTQYWGLGYLAVTGSVGEVSKPILGFASYFVHWSSVGGLIGFAVSKNSGRGSLIGAITGAILSALLMC